MTDINVHKPRTTNPPSRGKRSKKAVPPSAPLVGYLRVSTDGQAESGLGLEAQRHQLEQYAALYGLELGEVVVDAGYSARSLERPGIRRVLELLESGQGGGVIVSKLDRLTRSVRDMGSLVERYFADGRLRLVSVGEQVDTSTAAGRLVLNVLTSVAEWERETIGERTRAALAAKRRRGEHVGGVPIGFERDPDRPGHLRPRADPDDSREGVMRREVLLMRERGHTIRAIADELTRRGLPAPRGSRRWHATTVARILARERRPEESRE